VKERDWNKGMKTMEYTKEQTAALRTILRKKAKSAGSVAGFSIGHNRAT